MFRSISYSFLFLFLILGSQCCAEEVPQSILEAQEMLDWRGWLTVVVFVLTFSALVAEIKPPDITMLISTSFLVVAGVLTPTQFLEGFSNEIIMTIAMLCILVRALEVNGILEVIGRRILTTSDKIYRQVLSMTVPVAAGSAFLNNTPIVLLMTPIVRRWSLKNKLAPSKFLIPLSYAAVLGGACTLIGTSTNLVVYGLLRRHTPEAAFSFFELSYVALPCCAIGLVYLIFISKYVLPSRIDPTSAITEETREFTAEFSVEEGCPLANKTVKETSRRYFREEVLIQIERNKQIIDSPGADFVIFVGDRLVFAGDINQIAQLHTINGLTSLQDPKFKLDVSSSHFAEVVISSTSLLIGKTLRQINFRNHYGASVLAIYRQGWRVLGDVRDVVLQPGDTLMLLSGEPFEGIQTFTKDFYFIRHHEKLLVFHRWRSALVVFSLIGMVAAATMGVSILIASLAAVFLVIVTRSISFREAKKSIMWNILLLIACSFALGRAMEVTGVAAYFAEIILTLVGSHPTMLIGAILLVTMVCTELMTNNAAALIIFPIAIEITRLAGYTSVEATRAIGVTVAIGASMAFSIPTGYQTHMIVYGPGGYKFTDFIKVGIPISMTVWIIATYLIPKIWPIV